MKLTLTLTTSADEASPPAFPELPPLEATPADVERADSLVLADRRPATELAPTEVNYASFRRIYNNSYKEYIPDIDPFLHDAFPLEVRRSLPSDAEAICAMVNDAHAADMRLGYYSGVRLKLPAIAAILEKAEVAGGDSEDFVLAAWGVTSDGGPDELLGCVEVKKGYSDMWRADGYVPMLAVSPGAQGKGVGSRLLKHAEEVCVSAWSCEYVFLDVHSLNTDLRSWYAKRGYVETGEVIGAEEARAMMLTDGIEMLQEAEFYVFRKHLRPTASF